MTMMMLMRMRLVLSMMKIGNMLMAMLMMLRIGKTVTTTMMWPQAVKGSASRCLRARLSQVLHSAKTFTYIQLTREWESWCRAVENLLALYSTRSTLCCAIASHIGMHLHKKNNCTKCSQCSTVHLHLCSDQPFFRCIAFPLFYQVHVSKVFFRNLVLMTKSVISGILSVLVR